MAESVYWSHKIILWSGLCIAQDQLIEEGVIRICKEDRLHIGIADTHMLHAIFLFVPTGKFVLFDHACKIIIHIGAYNKTILCLPIHGLGIDIIMIFGILDKPALFLEHREMLRSRLIDPWVIL